MINTPKTFIAAVITSFGLCSAQISFHDFLVEFEYSTKNHEAKEKIVLKHKNEQNPALGTFVESYSLYYKDIVIPFKELLKSAKLIIPTHLLFSLIEIENKVLKDEQKLPLAIEEFYNALNLDAEYLRKEVIQTNPFMHMKSLLIAITDRLLLLQYYKTTIATQSITELQIICKWIALSIKTPAIQEELNKILNASSIHKLSKETAGMLIQTFMNYGYMEAFLRSHKANVQFKNIKEIQAYIENKSKVNSLSSHIRSLLSSSKTFLKQIYNELLDIDLIEKDSLNNQFHELDFPAKYIINKPGAIFIRPASIEWDIKVLSNIANYLKGT